MDTVKYIMADWFNLMMVGLLILFEIIAISFYLGACYFLGKRLMVSGEEPAKNYLRYVYIFGIIAIIFHGLILSSTIFSTKAPDMGFYNALSLVGWCISLLIIIISFFKPIENLGLVIFPISALSIFLDLLFPGGHHILTASIPIGIKIHILLSIFAYSLLTIAALQAVLLGIQDRQLTKKHPSSIMRLPPMQVMEDLLIQIIWAGFFMLSLSLVTGMMFIHDIMSQHLVHKTVLSIFAWLIFGILLWGRWQQGWRGMRAIRWTIGGFISLMLAYFGSKFVLELILHRV